MPNQGTPSGIIFNSIHNYLEIMLPIGVLRFSEFRTTRNHLSETLVLNDIQITSDRLPIGNSRWAPWLDFVFLYQFDLNLFMITTENSSIFRLLTKESILFPIGVLRFSEFRTTRNHLSETLVLNDIQITSDYMSRWVVLKRRVGAVTSQRVLKVLFYVNILVKI
jgi:hypothetical protein